ncbi:hypothetical protein NHQ30_010813 [Ciborinia camelliae]|nr:hypothetical protein NHQ30_010813 [Ciborinia camelliae]
MKNVDEAPSLSATGPAITPSPKALPVNPISAMAPSSSVARPAVTSNSSFQVQPRQSAVDAADHVIDVDRPSISNLPAFDLNASTRLSAYRRNYLRRPDSTDPIMSGGLEDFDCPDIELGGPDFSVYDAILPGLGPVDLPNPERIHHLDQLDNNQDTAGSDTIASAPKSVSVIINNPERYSPPPSTPPAQIKTEFNSPGLAKRSQGVFPVDESIGLVLKAGDFSTSENGGRYH